MISIKLICVGNLKEKYWVDACEEYKKRLSRFCKLTIVEINEQNNRSIPEQILKAESVDIIDNLGAESVLLAIEGKQLSSEEFAQFLEKEQLISSEICFVIGGSYGVDDKVKKLVKHSISFGKVTYPHNLARVILLEQIYRAFMINSGSSYHK